MNERFTEILESGELHKVNFGCGEISVYCWNDFEMVVNFIFNISSQKFSTCRTLEVYSYYVENIFHNF